MRDWSPHGLACSDVRKSVCRVVVLVSKFHYNDANGLVADLSRDFFQTSSTCRDGLKPRVTRVTGKFRGSRRNGIWALHSKGHSLHVHYKTTVWCTYAAIEYSVQKYILPYRQLIYIKFKVDFNDFTFTCFTTFDQSVYIARQSRL